jgi:hypothetical protein
MGEHRERVRLEPTSVLPSLVIVSSSPDLSDYLLRFSKIPLGIDLRHVGSGVAENDLRGLESEPGPPWRTNAATGSVSNEVCRPWCKLASLPLRSCSCRSVRAALASDSALACGLPGLASSACEVERVSRHCGPRRLLSVGKDRLQVWPVATAQ